MKELITQNLLDSILKYAAIAVPIAGLIIGVILGLIRRKPILRSMGLGVSLGLTGTAVFGLWRIYTALGNRYSYTNVTSLAFQLVLFAVIGAGSGFVIHKAIITSSNKGKCTDSGDKAREEPVNAGNDLH